MSSYSFQLPNIDRLTDPQQSALDSPQPLALAGGPGTGKSVVSLWRHIRNYDLNMRRSVLLTFTKSLCNYLQNSTLALISTGNRNESSLRNAANNIAQSMSWDKSNYEEIIIDEAQDLGSDFYRNITRFANWGISYSANDNQILYPEHCTTEEELKTLFPSNFPKLLDENFRSTYEIMKFAKHLFRNFYIPQDTLDLLLEKNKHGLKPKVLLHNDNTRKQNRAIFGIIRELHSDSHNIAILVPLKRNVDSYFSLVNDQFPDFACSKYQNDMTVCNIEGIHVTTFKSAKGLEFDTVIIPDFQDYKENIANLRVIEEKDYYVAITRAKHNLYLISSERLDFIDPSTYEEEIL